MASFSPLSLPHHFKISASKFPKIYTKPTLVLCKASVSRDTFLRVRIRTRRNRGCRPDPRPEIPWTLVVPWGHDRKESWDQEEEEDDEEREGLEGFNGGGYLLRVWGSVADFGLGCSGLRGHRDLWIGTNCFCELFKSLSKCFCDCTVMGSWKKLTLKAFSVVGMSKFETMLNCNKSFYCFSNKSLWIAQ